MTWDVVLFDLDGTLTDSEPGVANGIVYALASLGIPAPADDEIRKYLGPPLWYSFREYAGLGEKDVQHVVKIYREYYHETGRFENSVFPGIQELLDNFTISSKRLAVATSKIESSAKSILQHFRLEKYFEHIVGADENGLKRGTKGLVIKEALNRLSVEDPDCVVMIGDREHDVHGARENNIQSIGVLWGYGSHTELVNAGAHHLAHSVHDLGNIVSAY